MLASSIDTSILTAPPALTAPQAGNKQNATQIMNSARDFEAVFATQMMTPMFEGLEVNPMFGGGKGEEMFRTVLLDEYGKQIGQNDSFNMANQLASAMLKAQEGRSQ
jgi:Rod binding domain-containing protein